MYERKIQTSEKSHIIVTKRKNGSKRVQTINLDTDKTDQSFKDDCDITSIINKFQKTGMVTHRSTKQGMYTEGSPIPSNTTFQEAVQLVQDAQNRFESLPATTRDRFKNDPSNLLAFLSDPKNQEEAFNLGLTTRQPQNDESNDEQAVPSSKKQKKQDPPKPDPE